MKAIRLGLFLMLASVTMEAGFASAPALIQHAEHTYYCNRCHQTVSSSTTPDQRGCTSSSGIHAWVKKS